MIQDQLNGSGSPGRSEERRFLDPQNRPSIGYILPGVSVVCESPEYCLSATKTADGRARATKARAERSTCTLRLDPVRLLERELEREVMRCPLHLNLRSTEVVARGTCSCTCTC